MRSNDIKKYFAIIFTIIGIIILHYIGVIKPVELLIVRALNPVFGGFHVLGLDIRSMYDDKTLNIDLMQEFKKIKAHENLLIEENARLKTIEEENVILRDYLGFLTKNKYKYVMSNVLARGDDTRVAKQINAITVDKGSDDGIVTGQGVIDSKGILVGKVAEVKKSISKVFLLNNKECKIAVSIFNKGKTSGIVEGELGLTIKINFIPQTEDIKIGDTVVTSGLESLIPRGLVIGNIVDIKKESNGLWQTAIVEPAVNQNELIIVSILVQ